MKNIFLFFFLVLCSGNILASNKEQKINLAKDEKSLLSLLDEARKNFTFMSRPIHPKFLQNFEIPWSDTGESHIISADLLASFDTNDYFQGHVKTGIQDNKYEFIYLNMPEGSIYRYRKIGALENGMYAVITDDNGGGSLTISRLQILDFGTEKAVGADLKPYYRAIIKIFSNILLPQKIDLLSAHIKANKVIFSDGTEYDFSQN